MKKDQGFTFLGIIIVIVALVVVGGAVYYAGTQKQIKEEDISSKTKNTLTKIEGNTDDLVFFSVKPGDTVSGVLNFEGEVKNAYFFEANIRVNILDKDKKVLKEGHGTASTDWMTSEPVSFSGSIDLSGLPPGPGYIQIANDNPSGLPENDKFIFIPVIIE